MKATAKTRLDVLLVERGVVDSRQRAQATILAGEVWVNGKRVTKAGTLVATDAAIEIVSKRMKYASRGGQKLEGALEDLGVQVEGKVCVDTGSSTGGFTDCLLQRGARRVYAVDVNVDQLAWELRHDPRVTVIEKNARAIEPKDVPEPPDLVTVDVSFISVTKVLPALVQLARDSAEFLILVKPQFELERGQVGKGGIVRSAKLQERAVEKVRRAAEENGLLVQDVKPSRIPGAEGNQEFFIHARKQAAASGSGRAGNSPAGTGQP